jgi:hypothetical protein
MLKAKEKNHLSSTENQSSFARHGTNRVNTSSPEPFFELSKNPDLLIAAPTDA